MQVISVDRKIESEILLIPELKGLIGKNVKIKIIPQQVNKLNKNDNNSKLGNYDLEGAFDKLNVRDFANES